MSLTWLVNQTTLYHAMPGYVAVYSEHATAQTLLHQTRAVNATLIPKLTQPRETRGFGCRALGLGFGFVWVVALKAPPCLPSIRECLHSLHATSWTAAPGPAQY